MHSSIALKNSPCELLNITPINPLISKCQIKVCYVGEQPNRNRSVITKETARQLANSLPGSPIVGYYDQETNDFDEHSRELIISEGKIKFKDITRPYGFVDLNAKVWFQKFLDDGINEREYLVTEGYLWTGQYPEAQRIIDKGNNQSMELDDKNITAHWTKDSNGKPQFFIINEAIISKLCVLGEVKEPCFEGSHITAPQITFSFEDSFKEQLFSMMEEIKTILDDEGGAKMDKVEVVEVVKTPEEEAPVAEEAQAVETVVDEVTAGEDAPEAEEEKTEFAKEEEEEEKTEDKKCPECGKPLSECTCKHEEEKEDKKNYVLEEVVEYAELMNQYNELKANYESLNTEYANATAQMEDLVAFKKAIEKKEKETMINSFYMLSDEDKKEVVDNIDNYSLEDIEAKLSVICVRNQVSFYLDEDNVEDSNATVYSLDSDYSDESVPAWIKAVRATAAQEI